MKRSKKSSRACPNAECSLHGQVGKGNVIRTLVSTSRTQGRRRRYRCKQCGRTFFLHPPTARHIIDCTNPDLCSMKSSTCVVPRSCYFRPWLGSSGWPGAPLLGGLSWLRHTPERFNNRMLKGFVIRELQADEIRTFVGAKKRVIWVLTTLEVLVQAVDLCRDRSP